MFLQCNSKESRKLLFNFIVSFSILWFFGYILPKIIDLFLSEFYNPEVSGGIEVFMNNTEKTPINILLYNYIKIIKLYFRGI